MAVAVAFNPDSYGYIYHEPNPNVEKDVQWYYDNLKFICSFYNQPYSYPYYEEVTRNDTASSLNPLFLPVQTMIRMLMYFQGLQPNFSYAWMNQNVTTTNQLPNWIRNNKVFSLVNRMKDNVSKLLSALEFDVENNNEEAIDKKQKTAALMMIKFDMKELFELLQAKGVDMKLANGKDFDTKEEIQEWIDNDYRDMDADIIETLARHIWSINDCLNKYLTAAFHTIICGSTGVHHYVSNGKPYQEVIMPYKLIKDTRNDDEYNRNARFVAVIEMLTPTQIQNRWKDLTETQMKDIRNMVTNNDLGFPYNTSSNITWWPYGASPARGTVACVTGYWLSLNNLKTKIEDHAVRPTRLTKGGIEEKGDIDLDDVYGGTIIGNKYLTEYGLVSNVTEDYYDRSRPNLPIKVYVPNCVMGEPRSIVQRVAELLDQYDAYGYKAFQMASRAIGKSFLLRASKFGNLTFVKDIAENLKTMGFDVIVDDSEDDDKNESRKFVEALDLTLDPNIMAMYTIRDMLDKEIQQIANVSDLALGQGAQYMGLGVQQNILNNASGSTAFYNGFMDFVQMNMQYAVEVAKNLYTEQDDDYTEAVIGRQGMEWLRISKNMRYSNPLVGLKIADSIDLDAKKELKEVAHAEAQNGNIGMLDFVNIITARNFNEVKRDLKYANRKREEKDEEKAATEQMIKQLNEQNKQLQDAVNQLTGNAAAASMQERNQAHDMASKVADAGIQADQAQQAQQAQQVQQ